MPRGVLPRLSDIRDAIVGIDSVTAGATYEAYEASWGVQRAVERGLEIISEASRHIPADLKVLAPDIPWRQIAAIGNLLRHEYQRADAMAIWNIVKVHLPDLAEATERLILETKLRGAE